MTCCNRTGSIMIGPRGSWTMQTASRGRCVPPTSRCPGSSRASTSSSVVDSAGQDVGGRDKPGHGVLAFGCQPHAGVDWSRALRRDAQVFVLVEHAVERVLVVF